jgi:hypothetical protein
MSPKRPNRYPGVQPFQKEQAHLFFGRDEDIERLYDLILLEKLIVLFGKSGYGKSSLLNAGILPKLEEETAKGRRSYLPVQVRFHMWSETDSPLSVKFLFRFLGALPEDNKGIIGSSAVPETIWSLLKFSRPSPNTVFVLIFDQFEEFFTYPESQQQEFKRQLAEVLYADLPAYVKQNEDKLTPGELAFFSEKMDVRAVFAIRSDRMSDLDRLKDKLPAILHKRFELRALNREQAKEALVEPARKEGDFESPKFEWTDEALKRVLDEFSRDNQGREVGVEAFLLQVLAQNVENQVIRGDITDRDGNGLPDVSPEDLPADLSNIFSEYYRNKISSLAPEQQLPARKLIEDGLIFTAGEGEARRLSMDADVLMRQSGADSSLLKALEDTFLLRREVNTTGGWNYELSHDTLLKPVLDWREERLAQEERETQRIEAEKARERAEVLERQAAEERRRAEEAQRLQRQAEEGKRKAQRMSFIAIVMAVLACLGLLGAWYLYGRAEKEKDKAEIERNNALRSDSLAQLKAREAQRSDSLAQIDKRNAEQALEKASQEQLKKLRSDASLFRKEKRYADAIRAYEEALQLITDPVERRETLTEITRTRAEQIQADFERNRDTGIALKEANQCKAAIPYLEVALKAKPGDPVTQKALSDCLSKTGKQ